MTNGERLMVLGGRGCKSTYSQEGVGYIHAHINSVADKREVNEVTPSVVPLSLECQSRGR